MGQVQGLGLVDWERDSIIIETVRISFRYFCTLDMNAPFGMEFTGSIDLYLMPHKDDTRDEALKHGMHPSYLRHTPRTSQLRDRPRSLQQR